MTEIDTIKKLATDVGAQHDELTSAIEAQQDTEANVLAAAIAAAKPAWRALSSRLTRRDASTSGQNGCNPVQEIEYHDERGCVLAGSISREKDVTGNGGQYVGEELVLLSDGTLAVMVATGTWSLWQGSWNRLALSLEPISAQSAVREFDLDEILETLAQKLTEQAQGNATKRAASARARAEKLSAVAKLI